jgi:hypothetical protein
MDDTQKSGSYRNNSKLYFTRTKICQVQSNDTTTSITFTARVQTNELRTFAAGKVWLFVNKSMFKVKKNFIMQ